MHLEVAAFNEISNATAVRATRCSVIIYAHLKAFNNCDRLKYEVEALGASNFPAAAQSHILALQRQKYKRLL